MKIYRRVGICNPSHSTTEQTTILPHEYSIESKSPFE